MTTNKRLLEANSLFKLIKDETRSSTSEFSDGWNNALFMVMQFAESGRLDAQPAEVNAPVDDGLLPCPFCGEVPPKDSFYMNQGDKWGGVQCCIQGPEVRTKYDRSPDAPWHKDAIEAWNTRARPTSQWIPVSERLPEIGDEVLVFTKPSTRYPEGRVTALARYVRHEDCDPAKDYFWDNYYGGSNLHIKDFITHWMPLPKEPT